MSKRPLSEAKLHDLPGAREVRVGIYLVAMALWAVAGVLLYLLAEWPSTCAPDGLAELYTCSPRLPESGRWIEAGLLTWLWATPMVLLLEFTRRLRREEVARV